MDLKMLTDEEIIEIRKNTANRAPHTPWSDSIRFARELEKTILKRVEERELANSLY